MHPLAYVAIVVVALIIALLVIQKICKLAKMDRWSTLLVELLVSGAALILVVKALGGLDR